MTTELLDVMDDRNPMYDPSDPRGVAAPDDPHADPGVDDTLSSEDYPAQREERDRYTCKQCDGEVPPTEDYCSDCARKTFASDRAASRYGVHEHAAGATVSREWTLDRVVAAVIADDHAHTASIAGEVALKERTEFPWTTATDTQLTLLSEVDGEVPSPIDRGYEAVPDIVRADSDAGQQLLADLVADMNDRADDVPQLYTEFGNPIDDWETVADLQERFSEGYWIVTGVVRQKDYAFPDLEDDVTAIKTCEDCGATKHVYTGQDQPDDVPSRVWICMTCGSTQNGDPPDRNGRTNPFEQPSEKDHTDVMEVYKENHGHYPFEE